jgi:hypothetical protein
MKEDDGSRAHGVYHRYRSYLLRLWQEAPGARWRASVQDAASGESTVFATTAELVAFLQSMNAQEGSAPDPVAEP